MALQVLRMLMISACLELLTMYSFIYLIGMFKLTNMGLLQYLLNLYVLGDI